MEIRLTCCGKPRWRLEIRNSWVGHVANQFFPGADALKRWQLRESYTSPAAGIFYYSTRSQFATYYWTSLEEQNSGDGFIQNNVYVPSQAVYNAAVTALGSPTGESRVTANTEDLYEQGTPYTNGWLFTGDFRSRLIDPTARRNETLALLDGIDFQGMASAGEIPQNAAAIAYQTGPASHSAWEVLAGGAVGGQANNAFADFWVYPRSYGSQRIWGAKMAVRYEDRICVYRAVPEVHCEEPFGVRRCSDFHVISPPATAQLSDPRYGSGLRDLIGSEEYHGSPPCCGNPLP